MLQYLATGGLHILRNYIKDKKSSLQQVKAVQTDWKGPLFFSKDIELNTFWL